MANWYRFYVRSKVAKNGSGWGIGFTDDEAAQDFITNLNSKLANNAKAGCVRTVKGVSQSDYELDSNTTVEASCTATYLLLAEDDGVLLAKKWVKIPGMKANHASHVNFTGAQIFDPTGTIHPVTRVVHVSSKYKDVTGSESDGEAGGSVDGDYSNDRAA